MGDGMPRMDQNQNCSTIAHVSDFEVDLSHASGFLRPLQGEQSVRKHVLTQICGQESF